LPKDGVDQQIYEFSKEISHDKTNRNSNRSFGFEQHRARVGRRMDYDLRKLGTDQH
jgi:hypothetical protein